MKHNQFKKLTPFNLDLTRHSASCPFRDKPEHFRTPEKPAFAMYNPLEQRRKMGAIKNLDEAIDNEALVGRY